MAIEKILKELDFAPLITIQYWKLVDEDSVALKEALKLFEAARNLGFFYLDLQISEEAHANIPTVGQDLLADTPSLLCLMENIFDLPLEEKTQYSVSRQNGYHGFKGIGASFVDQAGTPDCNEFYMIPKDDLLGILKPPIAHPPTIQQCKELLKLNIIRAHRVLETLLMHLSASLRLDPIGEHGSLGNPKELSSHKVLPGLHRLYARSEDILSMIKYPICDPPQTTQPLASHTDYGSLTLLFTTQIGLQLLLPASEGDKWVYVKPLPGHAIVNCGDALSIFSNGAIHSNIHRVVSQVERNATKPKYSLGYFCRPENEVIMQPLKGDLIPPVSGENADTPTAEEWIKRRTYGRLLDRYKGKGDWDVSTGTENGRL